MSHQVRSFLKNLHLLERIKPQTWQIACLTTSIVVVETFRAFLSSLMWCDVKWCDVKWCDVMWCEQCSLSTRAAADVSVCSEINGRATWELIGKSETIIWDHNEEPFIRNVRSIIQRITCLPLSAHHTHLSVPQFVGRPLSFMWGF